MSRATPTITSFFKRTEASTTTAVKTTAKSLKRGAAGDSPVVVEVETAVEVVEAASGDVTAPSRGEKRVKAMAGGAGTPGDVASPLSSAPADSADASVPDHIREAVHPSWLPFFAKEIKKPYWRKLQDFVDSRRNAATVFPPVSDVFTAFKLTPLDGIRVVILGQDPYHGPKQAHGLSFSVCKGVPTPPSLRNMLTEARSDVGIADATHGNLENWAKQGVFMLNAVLTVEQAKPNSHKGQGWETFTSAALAAINSSRRDVVFLLWGKPAQATAKGIDKSRHHVLTAAHPSPLSAHAGFMGCKHYSKTNDFLKSKGLTPIDWNL